MRSRFGRHLVLWLMLPVVLVLVAPAAPELGWFDLSASELAANRRLLGESTHRDIERRVNERFRAWFEASGLIRYSFRIFAPRDGVQAFEGVRDKGVANGYLWRVWRTVHKALYRFEVAMRWFAAAGVIIAASLLDGGMRRNIKAYEFGYANPVAFHFSTHGLLAVFGLLLVTPFLPFAIQEWTWPTLIGAAGLIVWKAAESYQSSV